MQSFFGGEGWIRLIAQGKYHLQEQSVYAKQAVLSHFVRCTHDTPCLVCLLCPLRTISANALRLRLSLRTTLRQRRKCAHVQLHATLRVMFACYVHCARFPQMLRACVSLCLRSSWRVKGSPRNAWLQLRCIKSLNIRIKKQQHSLLFSWCVLRDSNPGPTD